MTFSLRNVSYIKQMTLIDDNKTWEKQNNKLFDSVLAIQTNRLNRTASWAKERGIPDRKMRELLITESEACRRELNLSLSSRDLSLMNPKALVER